MAPNFLEFLTFGETDGGIILLQNTGLCICKDPW
jgi:hypothetical protein